MAGMIININIGILELNVF